MKVGLTQDAIIPLQLVIRDEQLFDFVEELANFLEGILVQIDAVRSFSTKQLFFSHVV